MKKSRLRVLRLEKGVEAGFPKSAGAFWEEEKPRSGEEKPLAGFTFSEGSFDDVFWY